MKSVRLIVHGTVQSVFFRKFTKQKADQLGIKGWVRNTDEGTVEIVAEGNSEKLNEFVDWCRRGPESAVVNKLLVADFTLKNFTSFEIRK